MTSTHRSGLVVELAFEVGWVWSMEQQIEVERHWPDRERQKHSLVGPSCPKVTLQLWNVSDSAAAR